MTHSVKEWMVRTRAGEIHGPYTQKELGEALARRTFTVDDEIAKSFGKWISAQSLANHDADELTSTHTRNLSTGSTNHSPPPLPNLDSVPITPTESHATEENSEEKTQSSLPTTKIVIALVGILFFGWSFNRLFEGKSQLVKSGVHENIPSGIVQKVNAMIYAGETQRALRELTQYHKKGSVNQEIDYLIPYSALLITEGDSLIEARKLLEKILGTSDKTAKAQAHLWLGYAQLKQGEGDLGESHFLESLQLNPKDAATCFNLAQVYLKQKKYSQALDYLKFAELVEPNLWLIHIYKGRAKFLMSHLEEARSSFKRAIETSPDRWIAHLYYSVFLDAIHENAESRRIMNHMFTRDPDFDSNTPAPLGYFEEKVSYEEYLDSYEHIMKSALLEEKEVGRLYLGYLMGDSVPPISKRFEQLAEQNNEMAKVLSLKIALDQKVSLETLKIKMARIPQFPREIGYFAYLLRGEAKTRLGNFDGAQRDLIAALALEPRSAIAHWAFAVLLRRVQKNQEAMEEIKNLLSYHPHYIPAIVSSQQF